MQQARLAAQHRKRDRIFGDGEAGIILGYKPTGMRKGSAGLKQGGRGTYSSSPITRRWPAS
jgi:hypothetical protein